MEEIENTQMNGDNWYIKRDPINTNKFLVKTISVWGDEFQRVESLIEAMDIIKKFKNQEDWILETRSEIEEYMLNHEDFRRDATSGT
jgi:hypothetical protein